MKSLQVSDLGRVRQIVAVLTRHGFGALFTGLGFDVDLPSKASAPTTPFARRVRMVLVELGPTFVKLGQVLSLRPDVLPRDVLEELSSLQDDVDPMPPEVVREVLETELGGPLEEAFAEVDFTPLGSASIAQVHRATLLDGTEVALKLQRQGIGPTIRSDIAILTTLARLLEGRFDLPGLHTPLSVLQEFDRAISRELDFLAEADNARRMARILADQDVLVPAVHTRLATRQLMVMDRVPGRPLSECFTTLPEADRRALAHALMDATYVQVFEHGLFHGDPHPGNLFVTPEGQLAYLDFGLVGTLTSSMQDTVLQTFTALAFRDADALATTVYRAGATRERIDLKAFRNEIERKMLQYHGASLDDLATRETMLDVFDMAVRFQIDLPAEFAVLARALSLVEGNLRQLLPGADIVEEVRPFADRLLRRRFSPDRLTQEAASVLLRLQGQARDLPTQLNQALVDLDAGRLTLVTRDPDAALLRQTLQSAATRVSLALFAATAGVGAFLFLDATWATTAFDPRSALGTLLLLVAAFAFAALLTGRSVTQWFDVRVWQRVVWRIVRFFRAPEDR